MRRFKPFRYYWLVCLSALLILACNGGDSASVLSQINAGTEAIAFPAGDPRLPNITTDESGEIHVQPLAIAPALQNPWTPELETEFWTRANQVIRHYADQPYGNTTNENEKRSYPYAMFDFLAGHRERALAFLQSEDNQANEHAHTDGIDYYFSFTLKGQIRKYFFFGRWLDPGYRQRMYDGARRWTAQDPNGRPHPLYGQGDGSSNEWTIRRRGGWVDSRNTDNLRAMRETSIYLMAEETHNETVRQLYKQHLYRYVHALYTIGMGEWDSETYHGHTFAAYLNLYDFARDPEVQQLAKAALDWLSTAAAVKYYHGSWGGPVKRDYGGSNVVFASSAASLFWLYFGDTAIANPTPERDAIHVITSAYRPPLAAVALARKQFNRPVELHSTKPIYENWLPGKSDQPAYWETTQFGQTYQMGSVVSSFADGDVGPFKLMANNTQRGVDFFVANTAGDRVTSGKHPGDQIGQYGNLLIWLSPASAQPFFFQLPKTAQLSVETGIWFVQLENTWLAIRPINLTQCEPVEISDPDWLDRYSNEQTCKAMPTGNHYAGFALEVGEAPSYDSYSSFIETVKSWGSLNQEAIAQGVVQLNSSTAHSLKLVYNSDNDRPTVIRDGTVYDWDTHLDLYKFNSPTQPTQPNAGQSPVSLGWKQGRLRLDVNGYPFETTLLTMTQLSH